jgi:hypothetical protein
MKTIEEEAKEVWVKDLDVTDFFRSGVEFAQRWIPVEEELPTEDTYVLTLSNRHNGDVYYRVIWFRHGSFFSTEQTSNITHWRPIELK